MKLLVEEINDIRVSKSSNTGKYFITGPFIQAGIVNGNKRVYRYENIISNIRKYITEKVQTSRALGELNHPPTPEINPKEASHLIVSLTENILNESKGICNWEGKAKILNTPNGKIVQALLEDGVKLAVSTRALGSLKTIANGINEVQSDFRLCTAGDVVYEPSAPDAFVCGVLENKEWVVDGQGLLREMFVEDYKKQLQIKSKTVIRDEMLLKFHEYLSLL